MQTSRVDRGNAWSVIFLSAMAAATIPTAMHEEAAQPGVLDVFQASTDGAWREPRADFDAFLGNHSNATGSYSIPGADDSSPGNWTWSIAIAADMPLDESPQAPESDGQGPFYYTGGKITLSAPLSGSDSEPIVDISDELEMCVINWDMDNVPYPAKLRSDDGTCTSLLSSECIEDMKAFVNLQTGQCSCPQLSSFSSCKKLGDDAGIFDSTCYARPFNAAKIRDWDQGRLETWAFGDSHAHHQGNQSAYDYIGSIAWPYMVSFNGNNTNATTSLTCVRAVDPQPGSEAPNGDGIETGDDEGYNSSSGRNEAGGIAMSLLATFAGFHFL
ncbi:hypothetical protein F5Y18DRAFT_401786 [Xylariaceae sp. FL1019]|nr:hypothetical protein F5Y18DRAFT_401786 [Xylariaceae sp. FL1019]